MMMKKLFPPTQIDQILEDIALQTTPLYIGDMLDGQSSEPQSSNNFDFDQLETQRIFHLDQIKQVCINYRLRFLDLKYFKGNIPKEGIEKIIQLEKVWNQNLSSRR